MKINKHEFVNITKTLDETELNKTTNVEMPVIFWVILAHMLMNHHDELHKKKDKKTKLSDISNILSTILVILGKENQKINDYLTSLNPPDES